MRTIKSERLPFIRNRKHPRSIWPTLLRLGVVTLCAGLAGLANAAEPLYAPASRDALLQNLTLKQAEELFAERNREVQLAQRAVESAQADILTAGARPNLSLGIGSSAISPSAGIGSGSLSDKRVDTVISLSQVFERGGKRELREGVARYNAQAAQSDRAGIERQQRIALYGAYYDLLLAQERSQISVETAAAFQRTADAAKLRLQAGDIAPSELARISVDALRAQNDARLSRAELEKSQLALGYIIGAERQAARIRAADDWPKNISSPEKPDMASIVDHQAAVQAAQARLSAAEQARELSRSLRTRDVTAGVQYEHYPGDIGSNNSYGVFMSVPLFTGYYYEGEIKRAEAELQAARDNVERVQATVLAELGKIRSELDAAAERVRRFRDTLLAAAEKAAKGAEFAYSRGAIGVTDLLDARRQLYAAQLESATAISDYAKAEAAWRLVITPAPAPATAPASNPAPKEP